MEYVLAGIAGVAVVGLACTAIYAIRSVALLSKQGQENLLAATDIVAANFIRDMREPEPKLPPVPQKRKSLN